MAKRTEQSDNLSAWRSLVKIVARDRTPIFQDEQDAEHEREAEGKIDPNKNAHSTENASNFRRIKSIRSLEVDYREKIPVVKY